LNDFEPSILGNKLGEIVMKVVNDEMEVASEDSGLALDSKTPPVQVVVTDIRMSFVSMVVFMVKWVIAAIPALIILWFVGVLITTVLPAILGHMNQPRL